MFDVSVIIPNYNGAAFLAEAIDSVLNQDKVSVEVIVVDDGSTDKSVELIESYGSKIKAFFQRKNGAPAARNIGLKESTSQYIKFLDSDDVLMPGILRKQLDATSHLQTNQIIYGDAKWVDEKLQPLSGYRVLSISNGQNPVHHILTQNPLTSAPLHKKNLLQNVGGFDEGLLKGQEFDLHLRLVLAGVQFVYQQGEVYLFRQGIQSNKISNLSIAKNYRSIYRMLKKQHQLIKASGQLTDISVRKAVAQRYLTFGKATALQGNWIGSINFFLKWLTLS